MFLSFIKSRKNDKNFNPVVISLWFGLHLVIQHKTYNEFKTKSCRFIGRQVVIIIGIYISAVLLSSIAFHPFLFYIALKTGIFLLPFLSPLD